MNEFHVGDAQHALAMLPDGKFDLAFTSPPYEDRRRYGSVGFSLRGQEWVDWLRPIVVQMARVTRGLVLLNISGPVREHRYSPSVEWLIADLTRCDGLVCGPAPYAWAKNGMMGSGGKHYHRRDWEPVYAVCRPEMLPLCWSDNTAFGKPPKFAPGGDAFSLGDGTKVNKWGGRSEYVRQQDVGGVALAARPSHEFKASREHTEPEAIANPGNVIKVPVGGHRRGHSFASVSEAAMPPDLASRFILWFCPPGGRVLDPFCGAGATAEAAFRHGRRFWVSDIREEQVAAARQRIQQITPEMPIDS
jgi:site-specific DNA-methyltransferase (adenine-specific)